MFIWLLKIEKILRGFHFRQIYLSVFETETIIYNNGSIDISDTFQFLYFVQKCEIINLTYMYLKLYWCKFGNGLKTGPRQFSPFPAAGKVRMNNIRNCT